MAQVQLSSDLTAIVSASLGLDAAALFQRLLQQKPKPADAIIFLQGDRLDRALAVVSLYKNGFARSILITGNNDLIGHSERHEENDVHLSELERWLIERGVPKDAIAIDDQSMNTIDQAINVLKLAKGEGWSTLLVVTSPFHVLRAYLTFIRQAHEQGWGGQIIMQWADLLWGNPPSGRIKSAREMLAIEMKKIKKYGFDHEL